MEKNSTAAEGNEQQGGKQGPYNTTRLLQRNCWGQLAKTSADVVHDEIELVILKISEKAAACSGQAGVITVAIGTVISFAAFMSLSAALIIWLTHYMAASGRGGACQRSGACVNRCRHCLHRLQAVEEIDP
ncbi:MAG: phage holin family protein [Deltaproteobacteria bacterium]|nr:phage holin family protein [Deltaproteobacteria bacterium]